MKTPNTPVSSVMNSTKKCLLRKSIFQETSAAVNATIPVSSTIGAAIPSMPRNRLIPFSFRKATFSSHT